MDKVIDFINKVMGKDTNPPVFAPGMYAYNTPADAPVPFKMHLRLEKDGSGLLIVNARTSMHLNRSAAEYAYYIIHDASEETVISQFKQRYAISVEQIRSDYQKIIDTIDTLAQTEDLDPERFFGTERSDLYSAESSAPYRMDCGLTYRMSDESTANTAPIERVKRELLTDEWKQILQKTWNAGIPHIVFTGGEPTLRPDLPELIGYCQQLGQVSGLITDGYKLTNHDYFHELLNAGLDHLMIVLDPREDQSWEAVLDALNEDIHVTVHITLTEKNTDEPYMVLDRLQKMGVKNLSLSGSSSELMDLVKDCGDYAQKIGISLVWDLPVPYSLFHPAAQELELNNQLHGEGTAWLYVEPDGDVLPAQGVIRVLGNLLTDSWESIWDHPDRKQ